MEAYFVRVRIPALPPSGPEGDVVFAYIAAVEKHQAIAAVQAELPSGWIAEEVTGDASTLAKSIGLRHGQARRSLHRPPSS